MRSFYPWPLFPVHLERSVARSMSLQFVLQELLRAFKLIDASRHIGTVSQQEIEKFLLLSLDSPFSQKGGVLDKLCFYSEILLQTHTGALDVLEEMRGAVLKLCARKKGVQKSDWLCLLDRLEEDFRRFFHALQKALFEARSDENVLVFLMENKASINQYLGEHTLENLLGHFFPEGRDQLRAVLYEGFSRRGFSSFFNQVEPLIDTSFHEGH